MFGKHKYLRRRVVAHHAHGVYSARIQQQNARSFYLWIVCLGTVFLLLFCDMVFGATRRHPQHLAYILPVLVIALAGYVIVLLIAVWGAFGVEELVVDAGALRWTRTALIWKRTVIIPVGDITEVRAITPWHGLKNHVQLTAKGKERTIGQKLLRDEAMDLAQQLRRAANLPLRPHSTF
jgi:hypothetical protein